MKRSALIGLILGVMLVYYWLVPVTSVSADDYQLDPPIADRYTFQYPPDPGGDSTIYNAEVDACIEGRGYRPCYQKVNTSAYTAAAWLPYDAIFGFVGHGGPGTILFYNGSSFSTLLASDRVPSGYGHAYLDDVYHISDVLVMVFVGCETALRWDSGDARTSLPEQACGYRDVDCAIAFADSLGIPHALYWEYQFWYQFRYGFTIYEAAQLACYYTYQTYGWYGGTNSCVIMGSYNMKITPARYGSLN